VAATYQTPGVYYEPVDASAPGIAAVRTDIAGFVGIAERGPVDTPLPVESWRQFRAHFGGFLGSAFLAYAVRGFFENGGQRCWVVRVAAPPFQTASTTLSATSGAPLWRIAASSPGSWGNTLTVRVTETNRSQTHTVGPRRSPAWARVASTSGFERGTLVRLRQGPAPSIVMYRVIAELDAGDRTLAWASEIPERRLPYDALVLGFDPNEPVFIESVEYTIAISDRGIPIALYEGLASIPEHSRYGPRILTLPVRPDESGAVRTLPAAPPPVVVEEQRQEYQETARAQFLRSWRAAGRPSLAALPLDLPATTSYLLGGGADGLAHLSVYDFIGEEASDDRPETLAHTRRGLRALEEVAEVAMVAVPDIHVQPFAVQTNPLPSCEPDPCLPLTVQPAIPVVAPPELPPVFPDADVYRVQAAMVDQCERRRDRIAILDPPHSAARDNELGVSAIRMWRSRFDSTYAALYYPWLSVVDPLRTPGALTRRIPPAGHVAGQYAHTDIDVGVHKAPANVGLTWAQDTTVLVDEERHGILNASGINVIRVYPARGLRLMGARTVSSHPSWRFVNVRRLLLMIAKSLEIATQWAVFEPNDTLMRAKFRLSIESFLLSLWQRGALTGNTPDEALQVRCDDENNPPAERAQGRLLAEVAVAPSMPFEFIVMRVWRAGNEFEITETAGSRGGR
jgi:uncharacterized protein